MDNIDLKLCVPPRTVGKSKDWRRIENESRMRLRLPRALGQPPLVVDARRRKLLSLEADLTAREKASRLKPRRQTMNN